MKKFDPEKFKTKLSIGEKTKKEIQEEIGKRSKKDVKTFDDIESIKIKEEMETSGKIIDAREEIFKLDLITKYPQFKDALLEGRIKLFELNIGDKTKDQIQQELDERSKITDHDNPKKINVSNTFQQLLDSPDFEISPEKGRLKLIKLSLADLGFPEEAKFPEIIARGKELGIKKGGDNFTDEDFRLNKEFLEKKLNLGISPHDIISSFDEFNLEKGERVLIHMKPISDSDGTPRVFEIGRNDDGESHLDCRWIHDDSINPDTDLLFSLK